MSFVQEPRATAAQGCPVRGVRFIREWRFKMGRDDKRDEYLTMGQRELLVARGFAVWDDTKPKKHQRESAVSQ